MQSEYITVKDKEYLATIKTKYFKKTGKHNSKLAEAISEITEDPQ